MSVRIRAKLVFYTHQRKKAGSFAYSVQFSPIDCLQNEAKMIRCKQVSASVQVGFQCIHRLELLLYESFD